jgi:hypothetical protein
MVGAEEEKIIMKRDSKREERERTHMRKMAARGCIFSS